MGRVMAAARATSLRASAPSFVPGVANPQGVGPGGAQMMTWHPQPAPPARRIPGDHRNMRLSRSADLEHARSALELGGSSAIFNAYPNPVMRSAFYMFAGHKMYAW